MIGTARAVARRLLRGVAVGVRTVRLYRHDAAALPPTAPSASITITPIAPAALAELAAIGPIDRPELLARLARGDHGYLAYLDGRPAHYLWLQRGGVHPATEAARTLTLAADHAVIYNARTAAAARGRGIYPAVLRHALAAAFADGVAVVWIYVNDDNRASIRGIERAGFRPVGRWRSIHAARWRWPLGPDLAR